MLSAESSHVSAAATLNTAENKRLKSEEIEGEMGRLRGSMETQEALTRSAGLSRAGVAARCAAVLCARGPGQPCLLPSTQRSTTVPCLLPSTQRSTNVPCLLPSTQRSTTVPCLLPSTQRSTTVPCLLPSTQRRTTVPCLQSSPSPQGPLWWSLHKNSQRKGPHSAVLSAWRPTVREWKQRRMSTSLPSNTLQASTSSCPFPGSPPRLSTRTDRQEPPPPS